MNLGRAIDGVGTGPRAVARGRGVRVLRQQEFAWTA